MERSSPWEVYDDALPFAGARYGVQRSRMIVVGLGPGDLLAVSPGSALTDEHWTRLDAWGTPRFLLAPNHFHNAGLAEWQRRYPSARIVAHARAQSRLRKKLPGATLHGLGALEGALPPHVRVLCPPGAKQGETWLSIALPNGRAWFITDAIVNEESLPRGPLGLLMRALGFREELMNNPFFRRFFLPDWRAYCAWVKEQLDVDAPTLLVPSHGGVVGGSDLTARLRTLVEAA